MPAQYVKPYVKRGKNDAADAEAICDAVSRPTMRFVPVKTPEQQSVMMLHRVRLMLNRQRTQLSNSIRAHLPSSALSPHRAARHRPASCGRCRCGRYACAQPMRAFVCKCWQRSSSW
jgi:transposase